mgnify:FL=1
MNEVTKTGNILNVFDSDTQKWVEITHEQQRLAYYVEQQISAGVFISAVALKKIRDEKLYLARGAQNFEEYITMLPFGRSTAFNYLKVADRFENVLPAQLSDGKVHDMDFKDEKVHDMDFESDETSPIGGFSYQKLLELAKLDDNELKSLLEDGKVTINDSEISLEDIKDMSAREASQAIKLIKVKYQEKVDTLSEEVKMLKNEKSALLDTIEANSDKVLSAEEKEKLWGGKASMYDHKLDLLSDADETLNRFKRLMGNANVNIEDAENLQKKFVDLIKSVGEAHEYLMDSFQEVTSQF